MDCASQALPCPQQATLTGPTCPGWVSSQVSQEGWDRHGQLATLLSTVCCFYYVPQLYFPGGSGGKAPAYNAGDLDSVPGQFPDLSREDPLEKERETHSITLAWKIPWTEERGRLQSWGHKESDMTGLSDFTFFLSTLDIN